MFFKQTIRKIIQQELDKMPYKVDRILYKLDCFQNTIMARPLHKYQNWQCNMYGCPKDRNDNWTTCEHDDRSWN